MRRAQQLSRPGGPATAILSILLLSVVSDSLSAAEWQPYGNRYAIILHSNGGSRGMNAWYWEETSYMYRNCIKHGFDPDNIRFFATGDSAEVYADMVNGEGTYENMKAAYEWAASACTEDDLLVVFWMSHGNSAGASLQDKGISYSEIGEWTNAVNARIVIGGYQPCKSGGMVDDLSRPGVITATSTSTRANNAFPWSYNWPLAFDGAPADSMYKNMYHNMVPSKARVDTDGDGVTNATEAYIWIMKQYNREGAMFDDNGDGIGGQYEKDTFDPDDPEKDGYIGRHYSLIGWKPIGSATAAGPASRSPAAPDLSVKRRRSGDMTVCFTLAEGVRVSTGILRLDGRVVAGAPSKYFEPGRHRLPLRFTGANPGGNGIFVLTLRQDGHTFAGRVAAGPGGLRLIGGGHGFGIPSK